MPRSFEVAIRAAHWLNYTSVMSEDTQRGLVAILAADVVGYSRLMEADEAGTLAATNAHRAELWGPTTHTMS